MSRPQPDRIVVFGAAGHLGQEVVARLEDSFLSSADFLGVVSGNPGTTEFEFRGELVDAVTTPPPLRAGDLVFVCTPGKAALEIVRRALHAQASCIDCTGELARQDEVLMPVLEADRAEIGKQAAEAPLLAAPGATTLAWVPILEALTKEVGVRRILATTLQSAAALGRGGLVALSAESIALFNQSAEPQPGPAGQTVAFDVIPSEAGESNTAAELVRLFGAPLRVDVMNVWVPTFVGEGASLAIELASPLDRIAFMKLLNDAPGVVPVEVGVGTRGLAPVEAGKREPSGPTLRDAAGSEAILVGGVRADASLAPGVGWRIWLSYDPVRIAGAHAMRLASLRFPEP